MTTTILGFFSFVLSIIFSLQIIVEKEKYVEYMSLVALFWIVAAICFK